MEENSNGANNTPYEPQTSTQTCSYDDLFPALPESSSPGLGSSSSHHNMKMRVGSTSVTQVFRVPYEERKFDHSDKFGESEAYPCSSIMNGTGAHIEMSSSKDGSLTFLVTGKQSEVLEARRKILVQFQTQASKQISIPKEHHRWILGKQGTKLKELEKVTATKIIVPPPNSSDIITITGTRDGIEKAEHEIRVCSDEQSKKAFERVNIPRIYHPFIVGAHNENLNKLIQETGARINVPPASSGKDEIVIAGEKEGVMNAKDRIEKIYKDMQKRCTTVCVEVPKGQHKYVIGPRGSTIAEILQETGVSVEMPPNDSSTGTITLRGPHDRLGQALSKVYEKANSMTTKTVDAPAWLHKYIIGRKGANIRKVTQDLAKVHVEFTENRIKIEGPPEEVEKVEAELENMRNDLVNNMTFVEMTVDPEFHKHIIGKSGANVNRLKEETGVVIKIDDTNRIRIEGTSEGVAQAQQELQEMVDKLENEKEKDVTIEQRHYRALIGAKGEKIKEIRDMFNQVLINFPGHGDKRDIVKIRGPKDDVDRCHKYLMQQVKELNESSYQIEVPIFKQFHKFIIGKGGSNIRKIRDETQTKIDLPAEGDKNNEVITITGKKANVEDARNRILNIQNELDNIVTEEITIPPQYYNSLIGTGGKLIQSISEDCGGVAIKFPPAESKSDKVTIRGPKEDVERAKKQLLDQKNEKELSSYTAEVRAKPEQHKFLIGKNGANIKKLRDSTGARIVFPTDKDEDKEVITIIGKKEAVEKAKAELENTIKEINNTTESDMAVDPRHHKHFVARRGEVLHRITDECGGVTISFPRSGVNSDRVVLKGVSEYIEMAKQRIQEIVDELNAQVTIDCVIPQRHHRTVMGTKGFKVQNITYEHNVQIKFPDRDASYEQDESEINGDENTESVRKCDVIRITGKDKDCEAAKQALLDLVPVTVEVDVPFDLHRSIIGQKGRDVKELMDRFDVHIVLSPAEQKEDIIKITGTPANVESAKTAIQERVKELEAAKQDRILKSFELKIEVNPEYHPKIIGRRGAVVTKIRSDHDVQINFPRKGDPDEHIITITGYEENANKAKDDIMKIVNDLNKMVKEDVELDTRVHSRLIGTKGRNIRKIMENFKVDIKFPRSDDANPNLVTITGHDENVQDAKDHLLNLEEEFLQDVTEAEKYRPTYNREEDTSTTGNQSKEFVVKGGPWEQKLPNTASFNEFPSFGRNASGDNANQPFQQAPVASAWGPRH